MFVALKTDGDIRHRARDLAVRIGAVAAVLAVVFLAWTQLKTGTAALRGRLRGRRAVARRRPASRRCAAGRAGPSSARSSPSALAVAGLFVALFPDVMPSTTDPAFSLTTTNAAATAYTLKVMTWVAVVFTPIVLGYQAWTYWVFRKRIAVHHIPTPVLADAADSEAARPGGPPPPPSRPRRPVAGRRERGRRRAGDGGAGLRAGCARGRSGHRRRPAAGRVPRGGSPALVLLRTAAAYVGQRAAARAAGEVSGALRAAAPGRRTPQRRPAAARLVGAGHPRRGRRRALRHPLPPGARAGRGAPARRRSPRSRGSTRSRGSWSRLTLPLVPVFACWSASPPATARARSGARSRRCRGTSSTWCAGCRPSSPTGARRRRSPRSAPSPTATAARRSTPSRSPSPRRRCWSWSPPCRSRWWR